MTGLDKQARFLQLLGEIENGAGLVLGRPKIAGDHLILSLAPKGDEQASQIALGFRNARRLRECFGNLQVTEPSGRHQTDAE